MNHLPVQVRKTIQSLFASKPEAIVARSDMEHLAVRRAKIRAIEFLEDYSISRVGSEVGMRLIWERHLPFCLFLRTFRMGHSAGTDEGIEWLDTSEPVGGRLLRRVNDVLDDRLALVAIASPDEWLPNRLMKAPFANLVVSADKWQDVVNVLVAGARLIVMHRSGSSPGVQFEIEAIRFKGRQPATVIVLEPEGTDEPHPPRSLSDVFEMRNRRELARQTAQTRDSAFPHDQLFDGFKVLEWRSDVSLTQELQESIDDVLRSPDDRRFEALPVLDTGWSDTEEAARYLDYAQRGYMAAERCVAAGSLRFAEELLFECVGTSAAADNPGGRGSACLELGRLLLTKMGDAQSARVPLEYASGHLSVFAHGTPLAQESTLKAMHLYAAAQVACGNEPGALAILEEAEAIEHRQDDLSWQVTFWRDTMPVIGYANAKLSEFFAEVARRAAARLGKEQ